MKKFSIILLLFVSLYSCEAQSRSYPFYQLYQLDSIGQSVSISSYFGSLYADFLRLIEKRLEHADTTVQRLLRHFEITFAQFYIDAAICYAEKKEIPFPAWRNYFKKNNLSPAQYYLLGANAHLNGQLSEAIFHSYTPEEWKTLKKHYPLFNSPLNETYSYVYSQTQLYHPNARTLHHLTLGLDKLTANYYLYKWRKRQMRVTEYKFSNSRKYQKLFSRIQRKRDAIDKLIMYHLYPNKTSP